MGERSSGRRIVLHEYPKRDLPYAEDMGRRAKRFRVTAYLIQYPSDAAEGAGPAMLLRRDYRIVRDLLIDALDREGSGELVLPTRTDGKTSTLTVVVDGFTETEIKEKGGFCTFEIQFCEVGAQGNEGITVDTSVMVQQNADALRAGAQQMVRDSGLSP